jgi:hypothetical protein
MPKTLRPYDPDQMLLLPPSVRDWVRAGDLAHFINDVVDVLDLVEIEKVYEEELRGYPSYQARSLTQGHLPWACCDPGRRLLMWRTTWGIPISRSPGRTQRS